MAYRKIELDGRLVAVRDDPPPPPRNPPLLALNLANREHESERQAEAMEAAAIAASAIRSAFGPVGRRVQKPLRPVSK